MKPRVPVFCRAGIKTIDKNLLSRGLRIRKGVLYVKESLSQRDVSRWDLIPGALFLLPFKRLGALRLWGLSAIGRVGAPNIDADPSLPEFVCRRKMADLRLLADELAD